MSENKSFKQFRHALNENEYSEVLTGYPNRSAAPCGAIKFDSDMIARANGVLNAISRSTFSHPNDAFIKIKTRLNLLMLDFPWTPYLWQDGGTGITTLTVTRYGRVDGVDALTGAIRMDGKANTMDGFKEYVLTATTERGEDGLFRVSASLSEREQGQVEESWGGGFETSREAWAKLAKQERAEAKRAREAKKAKEKAAAKAAKAKKTVKESLVGKQHKLDVNKNKRLDSQDFKLLRAKKKVAEETETIDEGKTAKIRRLQNRLGYKAANIRSGYAKDTPEAQAKIKKLKGIASKLSAKQEKTNQRRAETQFPHSDPKVAKADWDQRARVRGGSLRAIVKRDKPVRWYNPKGRETQKESVNPEFTTGMPLVHPDPALMQQAPLPKAHRKPKRKS